MLLFKWLCCFKCCLKRTECYKRRQKRLARHELAQEHLAKETEFFKFLKLLRTTDFLAKVMLRKYQRDLVPYFKKYQLTGLDDSSQNGRKVFSSEILGAKTMNLLEGEEFEERQLIMNKKMHLMDRVKDCFTSEVLEARDLAILYEITGY